MKKILLFSIALLLANALRAQTIPNGGFENWNTTNYETPDNWNTSNREYIEDGGPVTVTKVPGVSGFAVRLETIITPPDTFVSYIINSDGDPFAGVGGVPFSQLPTAFTGSFKYDIGAGDTAILLVFFKKNGAIISNDMFKVYGSQSTFTSFSFPLNVSIVPDSVIVGATSSDFISNNASVANGSYLELDNLGFSGPGVTQSLIGGNFDNWTNYSLLKLNDWTEEHTEGISRITSSHTGQYAIRMETVNGPDGVSSSGIRLGDNSMSGPTGGIPFSQMIDTLYGYYKFSTPVSDSAWVICLATNNSNVVGGMEIRLFPAGPWTYFEVPINCFIMPDTLNISFRSSYGYPLNNSNLGSVLKLDDVALKSQAVGLNTINPFDNPLVTYPNPVGDIVNFNWKKVIHEDINISIYNMNGQEVLNQLLPGSGNTCKLNVKELPAGTYLVRLESASKIWKTSFIKQ